jgi:uncharacterized repeat protein (TIGR01451 family)
MPARRSAWLLAALLAALLATLAPVAASAPGAADPTANADPTADFALTKDANLHQARPGQHIRYTIVATNRGPDPAGVVVIDVVDDALQPLAIRCGRGGTPQDGDACVYPRLRSGGRATTWVEAAVVDDSFDVAGNSACAQAVGATDPDPANNCAGVTIPVVTGRHGRHGRH